MELIPHLEENYNAKIKKSLVTLGETAAQNCDYLEAKAKALFEDVLINREASLETTVLDIHKLRESPQILQQMIIKEAIIRLDIPLKKLSNKNYKDILNTLNSEKTSAINVVKEYLNVRREGNELHLSKSRYCTEETPVISETEIKVPGVTELVDMNCRVRTEIIEIKNDFLEEFKQNKTSYEEAVDFDKISKPLAVRARKPGDRFWPLGAQGFKKIKDFFIDNKVPVMERDTVPIVTMNGEPIWLVGFRIDDRIRVSEETTNLLMIKVEI